MTIIAAPFCRKPEQGDVYCDTSTQSTYGPLMFVIEDSNGSQRSYPLSWLEYDDFTFEKMRSKISGVNTPNTIIPVGKITSKLVFEVLK